MPVAAGMLHQQSQVIKLIFCEKDIIIVVSKVVMQKEHMEIIAGIYFVCAPGLAYGISLIAVPLNGLLSFICRPASLPASGSPRK